MKIFSSIKSHQQITQAACENDFLIIDKLLKIRNIKPIFKRIGLIIMNKKELIEKAVKRSSEIYIKELRKNVEIFYSDTFLFNNSMKINKKAFGKDI